MQEVHDVQPQLKVGLQARQRERGPEGSSRMACIRIEAEVEDSDIGASPQGRAYVGLIFGRVIGVDDGTKPFGQAIGVRSDPGRGGQQQRKQTRFHSTGARNRPIQSFKRRIG